MREREGGRERRVRYLKSSREVSGGRSGAHVCPHVPKTVHQTSTNDRLSGPSPSIISARVPAPQALSSAPAYADDEDDDDVRHCCHLAGSNPPGPLKFTPRSAFQVKVNFSWLPWACNDCHSPRIKASCLRRFSSTNIASHRIPSYRIATFAVTTMMLLLFLPGLGLLVAFRVRGLQTPLSFLSCFRHQSPFPLSSFIA